MQSAHVGAGNLEGERNGTAADNKIRLAGVGERADVVRKSRAKRVVVNAWVDRDMIIMMRRRREADSYSSGIPYAPVPSPPSSVYPQFSTPICAGFSKDLGANGAGVQLMIMPYISISSTSSPSASASVISMSSSRTRIPTIFA